MIEFPRILLGIAVLDGKFAMSISIVHVRISSASRKVVRPSTQKALKSFCKACETVVSILRHWHVLLWRHWY
jgi:hypothetical protein